MEFALLGWPPDGPTLRLDHRAFAYAGKFVMSNTGTAVVRDPHREYDDPASDAGAAPDSSAPDSAPASDAGPAPASDIDTDVLAAIAFNADRTDDATLWYRYVTVRSDARGEGLGPRLAAFVATRAAERGYDRLRIAVNNPFAYEAMYKAGFAWTGRETGVAELVLERPADPGEAATRTRDAETYRAGLDRYRERDLDASEASFLSARRDADPPALLSDLAAPADAAPADRDPEG